jgi:hypothetical protein
MSAESLLIVYCVVLGVICLVLLAYALEKREQLRRSRKQNQKSAQVRQQLQVETSKLKQTNGDLQAEYDKMHVQNSALLTDNQLMKQQIEETLDQKQRLGSEVEKVREDNRNLRIAISKLESAIDHKDKHYVIDESGLLTTLEEWHRNNNVRP